MATRRKKGATLYLRGVPEQLVREAKAAAARRGITLTALVSETLARVLAAGSPVEGERVRARQIPDELREGIAWFEAHRAEVLERYPDEYVAITGRGVIDHDREFEPLARRVFARHGVRPMFMPKTAPEGGRSDERIVNIPSPRLLRT